MNWGQIVEIARLLLITLPRFGYGAVVDAQSLFNVANEHSSDWQNRPDGGRRHFQALDILMREGLVSQMPSGFTLTPHGQETVSQGTHAWEPDSSQPRMREWIEIEDLIEGIDDKRPSSEITLSRLTVDNWRQFSSVDVLFHPRLTVLTGANAAGKTTLLSMLAPLFSWNAPLISRRPLSKSNDGDQTSVEIGRLQYSNGARAGLMQSLAPGVSTSTVGITLTQPIAGIFISSHRSISAYRQLENLPAQFSTTDVLLQQFAAEIQTRYSGGSSQFPPLYRMKQALVSAAIYGFGNQVVQATPEALEVWEGFQDVLIRFLPQSLGFRRLLVDNGEVIIDTSNGGFPIEAASGGLSAMLELAWQIFLRGRESSAFTVCIDEPENHLHPELQRSIMPALLEAFPKATFIVATHSPFVVTSTPESTVYALARFGDESRVSSRTVDSLNASGTADDILQSVLGLNTPLPLWAENALSNELARLPAEPDIADLLGLRRRLRELGLDRQIPAAIAAIGQMNL